MRREWNLGCANFTILWAGDFEARAQVNKFNKILKNQKINLVSKLCLKPAIYLSWEILRLGETQISRFILNEILQLGIAN